MNGYFISFLFPTAFAQFAYFPQFIKHKRTLSNERKLAYCENLALEFFIGEKRCLN